MGNGDNEKVKIPRWIIILIVGLMFTTASALVGYGVMKGDVAHLKQETSINTNDHQRMNDAYLRFADKVNENQLQVTASLSRIEQKVDDIRRERRNHNPDR